jgi:S-formylglutathione hydrolase
MQTLETISEHQSFGGVQGFYRHESAATGTPMRFSVFTPPKINAVLYFLAGLTATEETFAIKAGAQRAAAELGLMLVCPDTSPRNTGIADEAKDWDFGTAASFYINATQQPWAKYFQMESYVTQELPNLIKQKWPIEALNTGIFGHSMGGHGALTLALRHPNIYRSVSAFAPITAPTQCAWGRKAFTGYLGENAALWSEHDASALMATLQTPYPQGILIDQGLADKFLTEQQLLPEYFEAACLTAQQPLTLRRHANYDHGFYFVASFIEDHLRFHHSALLAAKPQGDKHF